jgi:hypothetical protein
MITTRLMMLLCLAGSVICSAVRAQDTSRVPEVDRSVKAVDPSVHADSQEISVPEQDLSKPTKVPETYSRWGKMSGEQFSATRFWPAHAPDSTADGSGVDSNRNETRNVLFQPNIGAPASQVGAGDIAHMSDKDFQQRDQPTGLVNPAKVSTSVSNFGRAKENDSRRQGSRERGASGNWAPNRQQTDSLETQTFRTVVPSRPPQEEAGGFSTPFHRGSSGLSTVPFASLEAFPKRSSTPTQVRPKQKKHSAKKPSVGTGKIVGPESLKDKEARSSLPSKK